MSTMHVRTALYLFTAALVASAANGYAAGTSNADRAFTRPGDIEVSDWSDPAELARTWEAAIVYLPHAKRRFVATSLAKVTAGEQPRESFPTVLFLHGCGGIWQGTHERMAFFAENGYAAIAPVSFARSKYPQSCDPATRRAGMYQAILTMRKYDAGYALTQARRLPWVDATNLFLVGFSQGGIVAATFTSPNGADPVNARVVEGWTCHAGWSEYKGVNAPDSEPVLALVAKNDPWFQNVWTRGDCAGSINATNGSRSVVFDSAPLVDRHSLLDHPDPQALVLDFLLKHRRP